MKKNQSLGERSVYVIKRNMGHIFLLLLILDLKVYTYDDVVLEDYFIYFLQVCFLYDKSTLFFVSMKKKYHSNSL